jgi:hypothetical protein
MENGESFLADFWKNGVTYMQFCLNLKYIASSKSLSARASGASIAFD